MNERLAAGAVPKRAPHPGTSEATPHAQGSGGRPARRYLGLVLKAAVTLAIAWWLTTLVTPEALAELIAGLHPATWLAMAALTLGVLLLHAWRWQIVLRALGEGPRLAPLFSDVMVGMTYNLVLPTTVGGDVVRAFRCGRRIAEPHRAWSSSVYERLAGLVSTVLAAVVAIALAGDVVQLDGVLGVVLALAVVVALVFWRAALPIKWLAQIAAKLGGAPASFAAGIRDDFEGPLVSWRLRAWTLALSAIGVLMAIALGWATAWGLGVEGAGLALAVAIPVSQLTAAIPLSINGLGLREGTVVLMLSAYGFDEAFGLAIALALLANVLFAGLVGLIFIALSPMPARKNGHGAGATSLEGAA